MKKPSRDEMLNRAMTAQQSNTDRLSDLISPKMVHAGLPPTSVANHKKKSSVDVYFNQK